MISVIVPVYNAEKTLNQCVDSILSQKYKDFELLLINDGSQDRSGEICDEYALKDNRVRVFHQTNKGVSAARNVGLNNMCGEFVTFCDSDDWVEDTWLSDYINNHIGEDILYQNSIWHNKNIIKKRTVQIENNIDKKTAIALLYKYNTIGYIWSALFKKEIIEKYNIRFPHNYAYREDYIFVLNYCKYVSSIRILSNTNYHYYFPQTPRKYNIFSIEKFQVFYDEATLLYELCGNKFNIISNLCSINIYNSINMLFMSNLPSKEKYNLYKYLHNLPFKLSADKIKLKILFAFINISPLFLSYIIFKLKFMMKK